MQSVPLKYLHHRLSFLRRLNVSRALMSQDVQHPAFELRLRDECLKFFYVSRIANRRGNDIAAVRVVTDDQNCWTWDEIGNDADHKSAV